MSYTIESLNIDIFGRRTQITVMTISMEETQRYKQTKRYCPMYSINTPYIVTKMLDTVFHGPKSLSDSGQEFN